MISQAEIDSSETTVILESPLQKLTVYLFETYQKIQQTLEKESDIALYERIQKKRKKRIAEYSTPGQATKKYIVYATDELATNPPDQQSPKKDIFGIKENFNTNQSSSTQYYMKTQSTSKESNSSNKQTPKPSVPTQTRIYNPKPSPVLTKADGTPVLAEANLKSHEVLALKRAEMFISKASKGQQVRRGETRYENISGNMWQVFPPQFVESLPFEAIALSEYTSCQKTALQKPVLSPLISSVVTSSSTPTMTFVKSPNLTKNSPLSSPGNMLLQSPLPSIESIQNNSNDNTNNLIMPSLTLNDETIAITNSIS